MNKHRLPWLGVVSREKDEKMQTVRLRVGMDWSLFGAV